MALHEGLELGPQVPWYVRRPTRVGGPARFEGPPRFGPVRCVTGRVTAPRMRRPRRQRPRGSALGRLSRGEPQRAEAHILRPAAVAAAAKAAKAAPGVPVVQGLVHGFAGPSAALGVVPTEIAPQRPTSTTAAAAATAAPSRSGRGRTATATVVRATVVVRLGAVARRAVGDDGVRGTVEQRAPETTTTTVTATAARPTRRLCSKQAEKGAREKAAENSMGHEK